MVGGLVVCHSNHTPCEALLGYTPHDYYIPESNTLDSWQSALDTVPDPFETTMRVRMAAKAHILQGIIEDRIARASNTKV